MGGGAYGTTSPATTIPVTLATLEGPGTASYTCSGAGTSAPFIFTPLSGGPFTNTSSDPADISVSCTLGASEVTGAVSCARTGGDTTPVTFSVTCPAGTQTLPTLGSNPADGGTININPGMVDDTSNGSLIVTPTGGAGENPATVSCSATAPIGITPSGASLLPGDGPATFAVSCPLTTEEQSYAAAVTCSGTDATGDFEWSYDVSCPAGLELPAIPTFIPASSLWSKLALFGMFAALGLLVLGLRRNH
ncbi:hypothetical protein OS176_04295 [Xanthomonadaceae bacterium XH05]|nr:hypothetical protein [Xanthomonadaceae bacterium XH05]